MRYSAATLTRLRTVAVALFVIGGILFFSLLWAKSGGDIPGVTGGGYKFYAQFPNIANLSHADDVQMAGVPIGTVNTLSIGKKDIKVGMILHRNSPLHQGVRVVIQQKTLIDESYVLVTDGNGPPLKSGTILPVSADQNYTSLNDVFNAIKPPQQKAAQALLTEFNAATTGEGQNLGNTLAALATLGQNGQTVFDVLANQTNDLQTLTRQTGTLLGVLDEGQGQIGDLASSAERVSQATSNAQASLATTVQTLPTTIAAAQNSVSSIEQLSSALDPVAHNLAAAAPTLNEALSALPPSTNALRQIMPPLNTALVRAPATLKPLPTTANDVTTLATPAANVLSNLDPIVNYAAPYKQDLAAFFSNFAGAVESHHDANSYYAVVELLFTQKSGGLPLPNANLESALGGAPFNPYPAAGQNGATGTSSKENPNINVPQLKY